MSLRGRYVWYMFVEARHLDDVVFWEHNAKTNYILKLSIFTLLFYYYINIRKQIYDNNFVSLVYNLLIDKNFIPLVHRKCLFYRVGLAKHCSAGQSLASIFIVLFQLKCKMWKSHRRLRMSFEKSESDSHVIRWTFPARMLYSRSRLSHVRMTYSWARLKSPSQPWSDKRLRVSCQ